MRVVVVDTNSVRAGEQAKAAALAACGLEVTLLTPESFTENYQRVPAHRPQAAPYRLVLGGMVGKPPNRCLFTSGLATALAGRVEAVLCLADENFWLTSQALLWRDLARPRAVFACHSWQNLDFDPGHFPQPWRWLYHADTLLERRVFRRADAIMARNREAMGVLRRRGYRGRLDLIPWAVDTMAFRPRAHGEDRPYTIGYVGRLVADKGVADLVAASRLMAAEHRLVLVGDGPQRGELAGLLGELPPGRASLEPVQPHAAMQAVYDRLDVLVLPSRSGAYWKEQFGRVLAEAMAAGVAVVGSSSGAIPDVIGRAGLTFPEGDPRGLAQALDRLAAPEAREPLIALGVARARREFSWAAWALKTARVLEELVKARASCA